MSDIAPPITISVATAKALLAFAGTDPTRPQVAIGVDSGLLCATDGHTAIRFFHVDRAALEPYEGRVWSAESVATAIKVARARKEPTIDLRLADALPGYQLPPVAKVCPSWASHRIADDQGPVSVSPAYLGRMGAAIDAITAHNGGAQVSGAYMVHYSAPLEPIVYWLPLDGDGLRLGAEVVIMPRRDNLNVAAIRRAHGASGTPCVRRVDKRWQPIDGFGAIMSSDGFNADRTGYDTKAGAVEALNGLLALAAVAA
jgi:hypothetical protein